SWNVWAAGFVARLCLSSGQQGQSVLPRYKQGGSHRIHRLYNANCSERPPCTKRQSPRFHERAIVSNISRLPSNEPRCRAISTKLKPTASRQQAYIVDEIADRNRCECNIESTRSRAGSAAKHRSTKQGGNIHSTNRG